MVQVAQEEDQAVANLDPGGSRSGVLVPQTVLVYVSLGEVLSG